MPAFDLPPIAFTLRDICQAAEGILQNPVGPVVASQLWHAVLRRTDRADLRAAARQSRWVRLLEQEQQSDGSWGRFHSQDTQLKSRFRTSEEAIDRALVLGLDLNDTLLKRAHAYILAGLRGEIAITDPPEKNERWTFFVTLMLAGRLAQLDPLQPDLAPYRALWLEIARRAFASGTYRLEDEAAAYPALAGIHAPQGFLESHYTLWILSSRKPPAELDRAIVDWLWNKLDGIRYLRIPLAHPPGARLGVWLRSMNVLARFTTWQAAAAGALNDLWRQRRPDGRWDLGPEVIAGSDFPLSDTWRTPASRSADHSTAILVVLRKFFDAEPQHLAQTPAMISKV